MIGISSLAAFIIVYFLNYWLFFVFCFLSSFVLHILFFHKISCLIQSTKTLCFQNCPFLPRVLLPWEGAWAEVPFGPLLFGIVHINCAHTSKAKSHFWIEWERGQWYQCSVLWVKILICFLYEVSFRKGHQVHEFGFCPSPDLVIR